MEGTTMNRRAAIRSLSFAGGASLLASTPSVAGVLASRLDTGYAQAVTGTAPVKIRDIKAILTAPNRIRLVVVKIETTEPGLVGWGGTARTVTFTPAATIFLKWRRTPGRRWRRASATCVYRSRRPVMLATGLAATRPPEAPGTKSSVLPAREISGSRRRTCERCRSY